MTDFGGHTNIGPTNIGPNDDDDAAFRDAVTQIYKSKGKLSEFQYGAQRDVIDQNIENLNETNRITGEIAAGDISRIQEQGAESQAIYGHDIASTQALSRLSGEAHDLGIAGLQSSRDYSLAGYDQDIARLGGERGITGARFAKGGADILDASRSAELNAYTAAVNNMYSSGTSAGFAQKGDENLARAAGIQQSRLGRDLGLLSLEADKAQQDISFQIDKTQLARDATASSFGTRIGQAEKSKEIAATEAEASIRRQGLLKGADKNETDARVERAQMALELENTRNAHNLALQDIAKRLAESSEPHQNTILLNEMRAMLEGLVTEYEIELNGGGF